MSKRNLKMLEVSEGNATHIRIDLTYNIGGMNYFQGASEERGLYLSVTPVSRTQHENNLVSETYSGFSGTKMLVKPMNRFSQKTLDTFEVWESDVEKLLNHVITKNSIKLV